MPSQELGYAGLAIQLLAGVNPSEWTKLAELWISLPRCYEPLSKEKGDSRALQKLLKWLD